MKIYIAGPISGGDWARNVRHALHAADELLAMGHHPYVPHLNVAWHFLSPKAHAVWMKLDRVWLETCDGLLRLTGESPGADEEVRWAIELGIPVYYSLDEVPAATLADVPSAAPAEIEREKIAEYLEEQARIWHSCATTHHESGRYADLCIAGALAVSATKIRRGAHLDASP